MRRSASVPALAFVVAAAFVAPFAAPVLVAHAETVAPYGACTGATPKASQDAAKTLFGLGKKAYEMGNDLEAIKYWRDSFEKDCNATPMLLNLANAYQRAGNNDGAVLSLETYLRREPTAEDAATIRARIDNIKSKSKPVTSVSAAPTVAPPPTTAAPVVSSSAPELPPPPPAEKFNYVPWAVAGGGLVIGVVGGVLGLKYFGDKKDIKSKYDGKCSKVSPPPEGTITCVEAEDLSGKAGSKAALSGAIGGVGGAIMIGGIVWGVLTLPKKGEAAPATAFVPLVSPGYTGMSFSGSF